MGLTISLKMRSPSPCPPYGFTITHTLLPRHLSLPSTSSSTSCASRCLCRRCFRCVKATYTNTPTTTTNVVSPSGEERKPTPHMLCLCGLNLSAKNAQFVGRIFRLSAQLAPPGIPREQTVRRKRLSTLQRKQRYKEGQCVFSSFLSHFRLVLLLLPQPWREKAGSRDTGAHRTSL